MENKEEIKKTYMETLPEGWKRVRLGEVIEENPKSTLKVEDADLDGVYPFFTSGESVLGHSDYLVDGENLFISTGGTAYFKFYKGKAIYSADTYSVKGKNGVNTKFLYYYLLRFQDNVTYRFFIGSGLEHLQKPYFKSSFWLPLFPLPGQKKIAEILETVDSAIEKTDKIIEKYKRIKQGLMQDLLTKGIDENGDIRSEKTHKFKDSSLGRISEEWEVVRLGEVCNRIDYGYTASANIEDVGPKFLRITDVQDGKVKWDSVPFCKIPKPYLDKYQLIHGDMVFARTGATTGKTFYVKNPPFSIFASYLIRIRLDEKVNFQFVAFFLNSNAYWSQINIDLSGSTQQGFNASKLKKILLPLSPLPEQQRIASILSQIDETIEKEVQNKEKLERLKRGLMEDLLTGKVRVNNLMPEIYVKDINDNYWEAQSE
jgi:type I restriction enzyme S subunit